MPRGAGPPSLPLAAPLESLENVGFRPNRAKRLRGSQIGTFSEDRSGQPRPAGTAHGGRSVATGHRA